MGRIYQKHGVFLVIELTVKIFFSFGNGIAENENIVVKAPEKITLLKALKELIKKYPDLEGEILTDSDQLRRFIQIRINQTSANQYDGLKTELKDGDNLLILPKLGGG